MARAVAIIPAFFVAGLCLVAACGSTGTGTGRQDGVTTPTEVSLTSAGTGKEPRLTIPPVNRGSRTTNSAAKEKSCGIEGLTCTRTTTTSTTSPTITTTRQRPTPLSSR